MPSIEITAVIYHKSISTLLADDVISWVYKKLRCDFRSPLMKALDWSVETLGREYTSRELCIQLYTNQSSEQDMSNHMMSNDVAYELH
jgi:hypothetical protein